MPCRRFSTDGCLFADADFVGTGRGSGLQVASHLAFGLWLRLGSVPLARYLAMVLSTHRSPESESA